MADHRDSSEYGRRADRRVDGDQPCWVPLINGVPRALIDLESADRFRKGPEGVRLMLVKHSYTEQKLQRLTMAPDIPVVRREEGSAASDKGAI